MKPLVSGVDAKRYVVPETEIYLLFPYSIGTEHVPLIDPETMDNTYPKAWEYLNSWSDELRFREANRREDGTIIEAPFNDNQWYRFGRHQNLDKQEIVKLVVPRLVSNLGCSVDETGGLYLDNVDVGGVVIAEQEEPFFVAGILNSPVANFVFKRISKPFRGSYLSANKQFIAPLPVPPTSPDEHDEVIRRARALQSAHTSRRDTLTRIARRLSATPTRSKPETWLFPELKSKGDLLTSAPARLDADQRRQWVDQRYNEDLANLHGKITARLQPGAILSAAFNDDELSFSIDGVPVINRIFVSQPEGEFILAQWKVLAATYTISAKTDGKKLANALRKLAAANNRDVVNQIIELEGRLADIEVEIAREETEMNALVGRLYGLTAADVALVQAG